MDLSSENINYITEQKPVIAIIAPPLDSIPSPGGNAIYTLVEYLATYSKFPILVFSINPKEPVECEISKKIVYYKGHFKKSKLNKIFGYKLSKAFLKSVQLAYLPYYKWAYNICNQQHIQLVLHEEFIDLIHFVNPKKIKIIVHQHAVMNEKKFKSLSKKVNEIVFVSKTSQQFDNALHKEFIKSRFIYNGIDLNYFVYDDLTKKSGKIVFLYVGRLHDSKGTLDLMSAFSKIQSSSIELWIIGDKNNSVENKVTFNNRFENFIDKDKRIKYIGRVGQKDLSKFYTQSNFVVVPSKGKEGLPKVISESVVMGIPVIASDRGGIKELIEHDYNGIIIQNPVDERSILSSLIEALEKTTTLQKNALSIMPEFRNRFSHLEMVKQFDRLFKEKLDL